MNKQLLTKIREDAISTIKRLVEKYGEGKLYTFDISESESPIVREDPYDSNLTYTLDNVDVLSNGNIIFSASNCFDCADFSDDILDTDTLVGIAEWLEDNEDALLDNMESAKSEREYLIREAISEGLSQEIQDDIKRNAIVEKLYPLVVDRIKTDADWSGLDACEINESDVSIALENELTHLLIGE